MSAATTLHWQKRMYNYIEGPHRVFTARQRRRFDKKAWREINARAGRVGGAQ